MELFGKIKLFFIDFAKNVEGFELFVRRLFHQVLKSFSPHSTTSELKSFKVKFGIRF